MDDMSEENGTIYVLPYSRAGVRDTVKHVKEAGTNDMIGYHGDDPGVPVIVPAGSIVCFSSNCFHRSGANTTKQPRRSYLCQYSPAPILTKDGSKPWCESVPGVKDGSAYHHASLTDVARIGSAELEQKSTTPNSSHRCS